MSNVRELKRPKVHILHYPAPKNCAVDTENGYMLRPWTFSDVAKVRRSGGWFMRGCHNFADELTSDFATMTASTLFKKEYLTEDKE